MSTLALQRSRAGPRRPRRGQRLSPWQAWGLILIAPYVAGLPRLRALSGRLRALARAPSAELRRISSTTRSSSRSVVNTLVFLIVGDQPQDAGRAAAVRASSSSTRPWINWLSVLFILPWAVPSIPTILSVRFMLNPEWGVINQLIFRLTGEDGPNWLNDPTLALALAIAGAYLEVAAVLDADPDRRRGSRSPAISTRRPRSTAPPAGRSSASSPGRRCSTLYLTCTILSMIWTLGDFNSVYLLTGGGPADLTHVLATLGIRYLRLDQVDLSMAAIVVRAAAGAAARLLHDEAAVEMSRPSLRDGRRPRRSCC